MKTCTKCGLEIDKHNQVKWNKKVIDECKDCWETY